jgi:uncharacterized membrane protein (DUF4010 family)
MNKYKVLFIECSIIDKGLNGLYNRIKINWNNINIYYVSIFAKYVVLTSIVIYIIIRKKGLITNSITPKFK